jgi:hypothetical protein
MSITQHIKFLLIVSFLSISVTSMSQITLTKKAQISLITCDPGTDIYNTFGHSAVRVYDSENRLDVVFNYGTFSFGGKSIKDQLNFGIEFARGKLLYYLSTSDYLNFEYGYKVEKRSIYEQVLNLTYEEKQHLFDLLVENYRPENRQYKYDFFYDNCSSRIRDIVEKSLGDKLKFGEDEEELHGKTGRSFMDMIDPYIEKSPWLKFGIYILLALPANKDASVYHQMFLPDYLMSGFDKGLVYRDGEWKPLVLVSRTLYQAPEKDIRVNFFTTPFFLTLILALFVIAYTYRNYSFDTHAFWIDYIIFFLSGLLGILLLLMWFATDHITTKINLNLIWALPTNIVALFFLRKKFMKHYYIFALSLLAILMLNWMWFPQKMHIAFLPLVVILAVRYFKLLKYLRKSKLD